MAQYDEHTLTRAVIARLGEGDDPRFKTVMTSLIRHLHDFVREVELTEDEWLSAIRFLTAVGQTCTDKRQEFILLSDTLGVSILVDALNHRTPSGAVESTILGPWYVAGVPELPLGADIANGAAGEPAFYSGRLLSLDGAPIAGGLLDVWSGDGEGLYDLQMPAQTAMLCRGRVPHRCRGPLLVPLDPADLLSSAHRRPGRRDAGKMGRQPNRPGHHMIVSAPGHQTVVTHLFVAGAPYLDPTRCSRSRIC